MGLEYKLAELLAKQAELSAEFARHLQKSILQEAIQGRLVPQDPNDEPASALLQRIKEEKQKLIKDGKLKKRMPWNLLFIVMMITSIMSRLARKSLI